MRRKSRLLIGLMICLSVVVGVVCPAQDKKQPKLTDQISQSDKAARVFRQIMSTPDKAIPRGVLNKAECVAVFPSIIKAGLIVGGRGGRGVASCRTGDDWSAPIFLSLGGASFGLQIGVQATDFVLLFMNREGVDSLLSGKFTLGGDVSVAAGPVGRQAGAETDITFTAQILSYSRSRGLFAGLELKGIVIAPESSKIEQAYGKDITPKEILQDGKITVPAELRAFPEMLGRYSLRRIEP